MHRFVSRIVIGYELLRVHAENVRQVELRRIVLEFLWEENRANCLTVIPKER